MKIPRLKNGITYVVVPKTRPGEGRATANIKYYAQAKARNEISTDEIVRRVQSQYRIPGDMVKEVLRAVAGAAASFMSDGYTVQLFGLGFIRVSLGSRPASSPEEFSHSMITRRTIVFTPAKEIERKLKQASYVRIM